MKFILTLFFTFLVTSAFSTTCNADLLYKNVEIGSGCSFETPFLWRIKKVDLSLPDNTLANLLRYESIQCIGKEVIVTASFAEYNSYASIEGGIKETISQISSMKGITGFKYSLTNYSIENAQSAICFMRYETNNTTVYIKSLFIIPNNKPNILYNLAGHYTKEHSQDVVDKVFSSIVIN